MCMCIILIHHVIMNRFVKQGVSEADMAEHLLKQWVLPRMEVCLCMHVYHKRNFIHTTFHCMHVGSTGEN